MGLRDKYEERFNARGFTPIELNDGNVQAIFKRCLAVDSDTDKESCTLFKTLNGFEKTSPTVFLAKNEYLKIGKI